MNKIFRLSLSVILGLSGSVTSADVVIDFENPDSFKSAAIYDVWEKSPFRTGELKGNWKVVDNPDLSINNMTGEPFNGSQKVLGAQRSRFGSNRFGVKIDLKEPFQLSPDTQYIHVMLRKPKEGRVMLVGLGSRQERLDQDPYTEQFWELSTNNVGTDHWYDAVFPVKGAKGVDIRSLVIVPDCESPHNLNEDFLFYVDNIELSSSPMSRIATEYYPVAGDKKTTEIARDDKFATTIGIDIKDMPRQNVKVAQKENKLLYQDLTSEFVYAKPGETITPFIDYTGNWMHAYCYVDFNNDGEFNAGVTDGATPSPGSEIVSYNYYDGKDSWGREVKRLDLGERVGTLPSFTLPSKLKPGVYRMRFKIDWNCVDPMGNIASNNKITDNGGMIADVMLCVYDDELEINDHQLNGEIVTENGTKLNSLKVKADEPFTIRSVPEKGFHNGGMVVKRGYGLNGESMTDKYGNPQYKVYTIPAEAFGKDGSFTFPAMDMRGDILINGIMVENGKNR